MAEQNVAGWATPYQFNAKELDENTGLYYYGARYYDPRISVWHGVDPLAEMYPDWSPYTYTMNNPITYWDPTGMSTEEGGGGGEPIYVAKGPEVTITAKNGQHKMQQDGLKPLSSLNAQSVVMENRGNNKSDYPVTVNNQIEAKHYTFSELYSKAGPNLSNDLLQGKYGMDHAVKYMQHSVFSAQADLAEIVNPILMSVTPIPFLSGFGSGLRYTSWASKMRAYTVHGNSLKSLKPTWGYKLYLKDGTFLKNGITSKLIPETRYSRSFMSDKFMKVEPLFPNRAAAYRWEFQQNQILRGPLNLNMH